MVLKWLDEHFAKHLHQVYQLRIQLRGISPPIWRRIVVSSDATIGDLLTVIQATMGWENIHLNRFLIRGHWYVPDQYAVAFLADPCELTLSWIETKSNRVHSEDS